MNARYYLSGMGRFLSADTIVPSPTNPQSFNRYSYVYNNPLKYIDPSGHCTENYADDAELLSQCIDGVNAIGQYYTDLVFGKQGNRDRVYPSDWIAYLTTYADIAMVESIMEAHDIGYGYTSTGVAPSQYGTSTRPTSNIEQYRNRCRYWQDCYDPISDYSSIGGNIFIGANFIWDESGNTYINVYLSPSPGVAVMSGNIRIDDDSGLKNIEELTVDQQEQAVKDFLTGWSSSLCASGGVTGCYVRNPTGNAEAAEGGFSLFPGVGGGTGYTWLLPGQD